MYLLDVIGPGDPGYKPMYEQSFVTPAIIIGAVVLVVAAVLITAVVIKKKNK